jgi:hypothetical protein
MHKPREGTMKVLMRRRIETIEVVALLFLSAFLLAACLSSRDISGSQSEDGDQNDWQTFTSAKYGFTVRFPSVWQVIELPTAQYPTVTDQVWFVGEILPLPQTDCRADIALIFTQEDPSASWNSEHFDEYQSDTFWLGDIKARRISGINKEGKYREIVVLAKIGDYYLQALPNNGEASLGYFDPVISSLRFVQADAPTPPPSATRVPENQDEQTATFEGTSFTYPILLAEGAAAHQVPAFVDPGGFVYDDVPEHVRFDFANPYTVRRPFAGFQPIWSPWLNHQHLNSPEIQPQIFIFPTSEYAEINPMAGERIEALRTLLDGGALPARVALPVLPTFNSAQDLRGQVHLLTFQGGRGLRFIARYSQGTAPVVNPAVFYTFQGLTEDGSHYVAAFFPLYVSLLPDQIQVEDWEAFNINYAAYLAETAAVLDKLTPTEFTPDLTSLDAILTSLRVDNGRSALMAPMSTTPPIWMASSLVDDGSAR